MLIDIIIVCLVGFGFYRGFTKGFVMTLFTFIAWMAGLVAALRLTDKGSEQMRQWFDSSSPYIPIITFIILFVAVAILVILFGRMIDGIITVAQLGLWNKIAGGVVEAAIFLLVFSLTLWLFHQGGMISPEIQADSKLYSTVSPVAPGFFTWLGDSIPAFDNLLDNLKPYFNKFRIPTLPELFQ